MLFKEHIKLARTYLAMHQEELADLADIGTTTLIGIEKGSGEITSRKLTEKSIRAVFEERGIVFKTTDKGFPYIEYDPDKDIIGYLKNKK